MFCACFPPFLEDLGFRSPAPKPPCGPILHGSRFGPPLCLPHLVLMEAVHMTATVTALTWRGMRSHWQRLPQPPRRILDRPPDTQRPPVGTLCEDEAATLPRRCWSGQVFDAPRGKPPTPETAHGQTLSTPPCPKKPEAPTPEQSKRW